MTVIRDSRGRFARVRDQDNGFADLKKKLADAKQAVVTVGIHESEGAAAANDAPGLTVAALAEFHEYGLGNPERSFIRACVDEHPELHAKLREAMTEALAKGGSVRQVLERFGLYVQGLMQQRMADGLEPGLADSTIAERERHGGEAPFRPLILTGQIRSSIRSKVEL